jgi:glycosyltransferase involved in cell wall biosynthesis
VADWNDRVKRRVYSALRSVASGFGGAGLVNSVAHETLRDHFELVDTPGQAELQCATTLDELTAPPRRILLDHGAFADATFWAFAAGRLAPSDTVAVTSQVCRSLAARMWNANGPTLIDLPLFADTSVFHPSADRSQERRDVARELDLDDGAPWMLCVGSYSSRKNTHLAVSFLAELRKVLPTARLLLVLPEPDGPSRRATAAFIDQTIETSGLAHAIRRFPALPSSELARVMRVADLLVHLTTCRIENFGLVVAEAMASGLPVLAADWGGLRDLVVAGRTGFLAPTHLTARGPRVRWRSRVREVARLLADPPRWSEFSREAAERAEQHWNLPGFRRRLVAAVEAAMRNVPTPGLPGLTDAAEDLKFATIWIQTKHPEVRDMSTMFRRLLDLEEGRFAELLMGSAATAVSPPPAAAGQWAYPAVAYDVPSDRAIRVFEPAWDEQLDVEPHWARLARRTMEHRRAPGIALHADEVPAADGLARLGVINVDPE